MKNETLDVTNIGTTVEFSYLLKAVANARKEAIAECIKEIDDELSYTTHQVTDGRSPKELSKVFYEGYDCGYKNAIDKIKKIKAKLQAMQ
jgi:DNA-directed RNA polymerase subunit M/transcription elongation factor TFIIS